DRPCESSRPPSPSVSSKRRFSNRPCPSCSTSSLVFSPCCPLDAVRELYTALNGCAVVPQRGRNRSAFPPQQRPARAPDGTIHGVSGQNNNASGEHMSTAGAPREAAARKYSSAYENGILLLLGFSFGLVFFDRNAVGVLGTYIIEDLGLSNTQFGMLSSGLAMAWALSAYFIAAWSDVLRARKPFVLLSIIVFSVCSAISGLATGFVFLLIARIVMGIAEGPFLPVCLSIMNVVSSPGRRGLNAGIMQNVFAALMGVTAAPVVLNWLASAFDWRIAFFFTGIPGLICALLVWIYLREPERGADGAPEGGPAHRIGLGALAMLKEHNIRICCLISIFMVSWFLVVLVFIQPVLVSFRGFAETQAAYAISIMGLNAAIFGFLVPAISDYVGR